MRSGATRAARSSSPSVTSTEQRAVLPSQGARGRAGRRNPTGDSISLASSRVLVCKSSLSCRASEQAPQSHSAQTSSRALSPLCSPRLPPPRSPARRRHGPRPSTRSHCSAPAPLPRPARPSPGPPRPERRVLAVRLVAPPFTSLLANGSVLTRARPTHSIMDALRAKLDAAGWEDSVRDAARGALRCAALARSRRSAATRPPVAGCLSYSVDRQAG